MTSTSTHLGSSGLTPLLAFSLAILTAHLSTSLDVPSWNLISSTSLLGQASSAVETCYNDKGDMVKHGEQYIPMGIDTCTQCTCMHGKAEMCISVLCSPPENCRKYHEVTNKCCEFLCLDGDMTSTGLRFFNKTILAKGQEKSFTGLSSTSLGLRLIASTVVSFLVLALLLFLIHRLRQRRLLLVIRRLQTRRLHAPAAHPSHASPPRFGYLGSRSAASAGLSPPFGFGPMEPPPPYSFWKAPELVAPGEAPPSYEESLDWRGQGMTPSRPLGHSPTHLPLPPHNRTTPHYPGRVVTLASLATRPPNTPTWASSDGHTHSKRGEGSPVPGQSEPAVLATARKTVSATGRPRHSHRRPSHLTYPARQTVLSDTECHYASPPASSALSDTCTGRRVRSRSDESPLEFVIRDAEARDCVSIHGLIRELAEFEKMADKVEMEPSRLEEDGFGPGHEPRFRAVVAECEPGGRVVAYCLFVAKYSTWKGQFVWIEDLYVSGPYRRLGLGEALLRKVVSRADALGMARVEWNVLGWNSPAISFYHKQLAFDLTAAEDWHVFRLPREHFPRLLRRPPPNPLRISLT